MSDALLAPRYARAYEVVRDGFVTPSRLGHNPRRQSGCAYRSDGTKVALSERFGGYRGDHVLSDNPEVVDRPYRAGRLPGRGVYLGHHMASHYGHFIFENLSTFWIFEKFPANAFDYFLMHPFVFRQHLPDYARYCLERFGIDPARIVVVGAEPLEVEELVVPERLARLNHSADPSLRWVYATISGAADREGPPSRRIYISRRSFNARQFGRVVANEVQIEALFEQAGFTVICPEDISYAQQIEYCATAGAIAGLSGSNLLNVFFAPEGVAVIELGDPRYNGQPNPCQTPANGVTRARAHFVPFAGHQFGARMTMLFDLDYLTRRLEAIVREAFAPERPVALARPRLAPRALCEIGYQCVRPTLGHLIRQAQKGVPGRRAPVPVGRRAAPG